MALYIHVGFCGGGDFSRRKTLELSETLGASPPRIAFS